MGHRVVRSDEHGYEERPNREGEPPRLAADVTTAAGLTMLLGEPPERVDLPPESVVAVDPHTALQLRNEADDEVVVFAYGAPPEGGKGRVPRRRGALANLPPPLYS